MMRMSDLYQAAEKRSSVRHGGFPSSFVACALKRFVAQASLRRTSKYASLLRISGALSATGGDIFNQPYKSCFFSKLLFPSSLLPG
jgi:hypothetical protein